MNNVYLHIIGSKFFYNLLNELNLGYSFIFNSDLDYDKNTRNSYARIVFPENLKLIEIKKYFNENNPTIFFLKNKDYLVQNNLHLLSFHVSLSLPIEILSFGELINILLTKYNFCKKSKIIINDYEIDSNQRIIKKNNIKTKLTEKELQLILLLNQNNGLDKSFLLKNIWNRSSDLESHAFETNLHRLRKKINKYFKDKDFLIEKNSLYYLFK